MDWSGRMPVSLGRGGLTPVTSQAVPRARRTRTTRRAPMNTALRLSHTPSNPPPRAASDEGDRRVGDERDQATLGEVGAVARADEHAVEDEHDAGDRLAERRDQQHRHQRVVDGGVAGEELAEERAAAAASRPPVTTPLTSPHRIIRVVTARVPTTSPAPR